MHYRFFRNASFNVIADFSNRISSAVVVILISKYLSVSEFGSFNLATTYLTLGMLVSFWGYGNLLTRQVAKEPNKFSDYFVNFSIMRFILSIITFVLIFLVIRQLNYSSTTMRIIVVVSLGILAEAMKNLAFSAFNAFEETYFVSIVFFFSSLVKVSLSYLLIRNNFGVYELAWLNTIINYFSALCLIVMVLKFLPRVKIKIDWKFCLEQTKFAIPLFLISLFSIAESRLDVIILSVFFSDEIVGFYSAALVLQSGLLIFPDAIRNAVFPVFSRRSVDDPIFAGRIYILLFKYLTLISLAITSGSIVLAPKLIYLIYDQDFSVSINIFRVIMLSYPFFSIVILNIRLLNAYNKDTLIVIFYVIDTGITIVLSFIFMPLYGGIGAAYLKVLTTGILYGLFLIQVRKLLPQIRIRGIIVRGLIASLVMIGGLLLFRDLYLLLSIVFGFLIYFVALLLMKTFGREEIVIIKSIINQRKNNKLVSVKI